MELSKNELIRLQQWFNTIRDTRPNFHAWVEPQDYRLIHKILINLGWRIPQEILQAVGDHPPKYKTIFLLVCQNFDCLEKDPDPRATAINIDMALAHNPKYTLDDELCPKCGKGLYLIGKHSIK